MVRISGLGAGRRPRLGFARLGFAATALVLATAGVVGVAGSPAFAVVPLGCGPFSGVAPPANYTVVDMPALGVNVYNSVGGQEFVIGTLGADTITMSGANDIVCGRDGGDFIDAGGGADIVYSGYGNDEVYGGLGDDVISGGQDNDRLVGDTFAGPSAADGNDQIHGANGDDEIFGYNGDDKIWGGPDNDSGDGGGGSDVCNTDVENPTSCVVMVI
jgi:hypothetical protein